MNKATDLITNYHDFSKMKRSILTIRNTDKLCLARATVVARAYLRRDKVTKNMRLYDEVRCNGLKLTDPQKQEAEKLCWEAEVDLSQGGGIDELHKFQNHLTDYKITVFTDRSFNSEFNCTPCKKRFDLLHKHRCEEKCHMCNHTKVCMKRVMIPIRCLRVTFSLLNTRLPSLKKINLLAM
jgi:hypothetical protein